MKKLLAFIILIALLVMSSCGAASNNSPTDTQAEATSDVIAELEYNLEIENALKSTKHLIGYDGAGASGTLCDGGDVCYFVTQAYAHSLIVVYDKETGTAAPLCEKENCSHDEINCSANIGGYSGLTYHDGKLYWVETDTNSDTDLGMVVYCEDVESTVRTVIKTVISDNALGVINAVFSGDKVIYTNAMYSGGTDGEIHTIFGIADINGEDDIVILDDESNDILGLSLPLNIDFLMIDDIVYYTVAVTADQSDPNSDVTVSVYTYDLNTGEFSTVCRLSSENGNIPKANSFKHLSENELYFMTSETHEICRYNISEESWQALYDFSEYGDTYGFPDGQIRNYVFVDDMCCVAVVNEGKIIVAAKDMDGNLVFETDISALAEDIDSHFSVWVSGGDDENIYCCFTSQDMGYTYQLNTTVAVPVDGSSAKILYQNNSSLTKRWQK